jgi:hypothetical protein
MEISIIVSFLSIVIASGTLIWEIINSKKVLKLEEKKFQIEMELREARDMIEMLMKIETVRKKDKSINNYYGRIAQQFEYINLGGLKNPNIRFLPLKKVYVEQRVEYMPTTGIIKKNLSGSSNWKSLKPIPSFQSAFTSLYQEFREQNRTLKLIVMGPAGSGKTTLLKWIALQCEPCGKDFFSRFIPIFIPLKELGLNPDKSFRTSNLRQLAANYLDARSVNPFIFNEAFDEDQVIFLFDGLDEVTDQDVRQEIFEWIQLQDTRGNPLLITTRRSGLKETGEAGLVNLPPTLTAYNIREFELDDIRGFLKRWYEYIETDIIQNTLPEDTQKIFLKMINKCLNLETIIKNDHGLFLLAKNPLLLTIIAVLQINRESLKWPMERHELYEQCLELMIDMKGCDRARADAGFAAKTCMDYLSHIAFFLMETDGGEMEQDRLRRILATPDDGNLWDPFLNEMVFKTGLLYEANGKFGFSHVTFQEYLAARYFAREKAPADILEFQDKHHWAETFKLYVNMVDKNDAREFFDVVIENLVKKDYWKQMCLWEECLRMVTDPGAQADIEIRFAGQALKILHDIPYEPNSEELIISLYDHYPLFKHARQFTGSAWNLFRDGRHPAVQSMGVSILNYGDENNRSELLQALKERINRFELQENKSRSQLLGFLFQHSNSFPLIISGRKNLLDFSYILEKLKSGDLFLNFLILLTFESLLYMNEAAGILKLPRFCGLLEFLGARELLQKPGLPVDIDPIAVRELLPLQDFMEFIDKTNARDLLESQYFNKLQGLVDEFENKYRFRLEHLKTEIDDWAEKAATNLRLMSRERLLDYFPHTSNEDIERFQGEKSR